MEYFNRRQHQVGLEASPPWYWKTLFWSLGLTNWSEPLSLYPFVEGNDSYFVRCSPIRGRWYFAVSSAVLHTTMILWCVYTAWWHLDCFYSSTTDFLFLSSFLMFYWPTVVAAPVICLIASFMRIRSPRRESAESDQGMAWVAIFDWRSAFRGLFARNRNTKVTMEAFTLAVFYLLLALNIALEAIYYIQQPKGCQTWSGLFGLANHLFSLFFYANFCFFLYLQRKSLGLKREESVASIIRNFPNHRKCSFRVKDFFKSYYQLRRFLFPCLNAILFSNAFGTTFFVTWWLNLPVSGGTVHPPTIPTPTNDSLFCSRECQQVYINQAQQSDLYIVKVLTQKLMMTLLALVVVGRIDLKYQWNRFKMKLYLVMEYDDESRSWKRLSNLLERIHPDTSTDVVCTFIIPLLGVVAGFMSAEHMDS